MANKENVVGINGAFEVFKESDTSKPTIERLTVLTRGRTLQRGDGDIRHVLSSGAETAHSFGFTLSFRSPLIIGTVNKLAEDSPDCDLQSREMQKLHDKGIRVVLLSKQDSEALEKYRVEHGLTYSLVSILPETAVDLGVALTPEVDQDNNELADATFWNEALCRALIVIGPQGIIHHIEQLMDQAKQPNYEAAELAYRQVSQSS